MISFSALQQIYNQPFFDLIQQSHQVHQQHWNNRQVQLCTLLSIKTGGCSEDCAYCAQSSRHSTEVKLEKLMPVDEIMQRARTARENGASRFCMGAAWKGVRDGDPRFEQVLETVRQVSQLGIEVCVTLGQLGAEEARKLKQAGVTAYNHNIDTSPEYYPEIVSTHTFEDRLNTIKHVQQNDMSVCCGGIIGMGEGADDRLRMLEVLAGFEPVPESVPINCLVPIPGTPMGELNPIDIFDLVRMIATTRIVLPQSRVRLSAGRTLLSDEGQALCFFAGANSIFYGEKLLTTPNPDSNKDLQLLKKLDLAPEPVHENAHTNGHRHSHSPAPEPAGVGV